MYRSGLSHALDRWQVYWVHAVQARMTATRAVLHFRDGLTARVYTRWCEHVQWRLHARKLQTRCAKRMVLKFTAAAFSSWSFNARSRKKMRTRIERTVLRLVHIREAAVFDAWHTNFLTRQSALTSVLRRLTCRQLHKAFSCWEHFVVERHSKQAQQKVWASLMQRMSSRRRIASARQAFREWLSWNGYVRKKKHLCRCAIARLTHRQLALAMNLWRRVLQETANSRIAAQAEQLMRSQSSLETSHKDLKAAQEKLERMFAQLASYREAQALRLNACRVKRNMHACFVLWHLGVSSMRSRHQRLTNGIAALSARAVRKRLNAAFVHWRNHVFIVADLIARGREKRWLMKVRLDRGRCLWAFKRWLAAVNAASEEDAVLFARQTRMTHMLARLSHGELSRAYAVWFQLVAFKQKRARLLQRATGRLFQASLARALGVWQQYWMRSVQVRATARRALLHFRGGLIARVYTLWSEYAEWRVRLRTVESRLRFRCCRSIKYRLFKAWRVVAGKQRVLSDERDAIWSLHVHYRERQRRLRQLHSTFAAWQIAAIRLQQGPEGSTGMKSTALRWATSMVAPIDDDVAEHVKDSRAQEHAVTATETARAAAEETAQKLSQEQAARASAEERANQEALRVEKLTSVIQRAEQRARAMDATIAEKSQRLAAAEAQLSRLVFTGTYADDSDVSNDTSTQTLLSRRSLLLPPHRLADGSGISLSFQQSLQQLGVEDAGSTSEELGSSSGSEDASYDPWRPVVDMASGSPPEKDRSTTRRKPSRIHGFVAQHGPS